MRQVPCSTPRSPDPEPDQPHKIDRIFACRPRSFYGQHHEWPQCLGGAHIQDPRAGTAQAATSASRPPGHKRCPRCIHAKLSVPEGGPKSHQLARTDVTDTTDQSALNTAHREPAEPRRVVDLERREDRFIIYVRDTRELIEALDAHTRQLSFPGTPVTRTVYFGDDTRGLPPGLSIKARSYERERLPGRWDLVPESKFELLEIKRTVEVAQDSTAARRRRRSRTHDQGSAEETRHDGRDP